MTRVSAQTIAAHRRKPVGHCDPGDDQRQSQRLAVEDKFDQADAACADDFAQREHDRHEHHRQQTQTDALERMLLSRGGWGRKLLRRADGGGGLHTAALTGGREHAR